MNITVSELSNDCLFVCKEVVRECVSSSCLNINCDEIQQCVCEEIDTNKFKQWFQNNINTFKSKTNQTSYFKKSFQIELQKGTFKLDLIDDYNETEILAKVMPTLYKYLPLFNVDVMQGFGDETFFIEALQLYIFSHKILTIDELNTLNNKIMGYITTFENVKLSDYREYVKKAQVLKDKVDWEEVEQSEKKERVNTIELIKFFEERDNYDYD